MKERVGEKIGWIGGFLGGFIWVLVLSVVFFFQKKVLEGSLGLLLAAIAVVAILYSAPWKHTDTRAWKLMLYPYLLFLLSAVWAVWAFGGIGRLGLNWWNGLWIFPIFLPFFTGGGRKWSDGAPEKQ